MPYGLRRIIDQLPESVDNAYKQHNDQGLTNPFGERSISCFDLATRFGGLVGLGVRSVGAIIWWRPYQQG